MSETKLWSKDSFQLILENNFSQKNKPPNILDQSNLHVCSSISKWLEENKITTHSMPQRQYSPGDFKHLFHGTNK